MYALSYIRNENPQGLRQGSGAGLSPRRSALNPRPVRVGFVIHKVTLRQIFLRVLRFLLTLFLHQCSKIIPYQSPTLYLIQWQRPWIIHLQNPLTDVSLLTLTTEATYLQQCQQLQFLQNRRSVQYWIAHPNQLTRPMAKVGPCTIWQIQFSISSLENKYTEL